MSEDHKGEPVYSGWITYCPLAHRAASRVSLSGNAKYNPGEPLHVSLEKSSDHPNSCQRHLLNPYALDPESGEMNLAHAFWRLGMWNQVVLASIQEGLVTREQLESGEIDASTLGPALVELRRQKKCEATLSWPTEYIFTEEI